MAEIESLEQVINDLEKRIGVPAGTLYAFAEGDDWSFIVKSHAFLEAILNHILTVSTDGRLENVFARMQLGGGRTGKLAFVEALELLGEPSLCVVRRLSELRNTVVHRIDNVTFSFATHMAAADPSIRRSMIADFAAHYPQYAEDLEKHDCALFLAHARAVVLFAITTVVVEIFLRLYPDKGSFDDELSLLKAAFGITLIANALTATAAEALPDAPSA